MQVWRYSGQVNRFGQPESEIVQTEESGVVGMEPVTEEISCRLTTSKGKQQFDERSRDVYVVTYKVFVKPKANVHESDRVKVVDPSNNTVLIPDGKIQLLAPAFAQNKLHHLELSVVVIRDPITSDQ